MQRITPYRGDSRKHATMVAKLHDTIIGGGDPFAHFYSSPKDYDDVLGRLI